MKFISKLFKTNKKLKKEDIENVFVQIMSNYFAPNVVESFYFKDFKDNILEIYCEFDFMINDLNLRSHFFTNKVNKELNTNCIEKIVFINKNI